MPLLGFTISIFLWWIAGSLAGIYSYKLHKKKSRKLRKKLMQFGAVYGLFAGLLAALANGTQTIGAVFENLLFAVIIAVVLTLPYKKLFKRSKKFRKKHKQIRATDVFIAFQSAIDNLTVKILSFFLRFYS